MDRTEDEAAITAMLSEMYQAWGDNDADGFVQYYTDVAGLGCLTGKHDYLTVVGFAGAAGLERLSDRLDQVDESEGRAKLGSGNDHHGHRPGRLR